MAAFFLSVGGVAAQKLDLYAGWTGPWYVDAVLDSADTNLAGQVVVQIGSMRLVGTVQASTSDVFVLQRSVRVVAGGGNWGTLLPPLDYFTGNGIGALEIARDAAREAGETLGHFVAPDVSESHFVRRAGPASNTLVKLLAGAAWWVDQDGVTQGGDRPIVDAVEGQYQTDTYSSVHRTATLSFDDPATIWVGTRIAHRLATPQVVYELNLHTTRETCRAKVWFGGNGSSASRLSTAIDAVLAQRESRRLYGTYRYRVYVDNGDGTSNLQAVRSLPGLPDVLPVNLTSGIGKSLTKVSPGEIVRVGFDEGDPSMPFVAHYAAGDPDNVAGIARMADLIYAGGSGVSATFSLGPIATGGQIPAGVCVNGAPAVVAGVPYAIHFGQCVPLDSVTAAAELTAFLAEPAVMGQPTEGYIASASEIVGLE